jgi:hypothetical protein
VSSLSFSCGIRPMALEKNAKKNAKQLLLIKKSRLFL